MDIFLRSNGKRIVVLFCFAYRHRCGEEHLERKHAKEQLLGVIRKQVDGVALVCRGATLGRHPGGVIANEQ